MAKLVKKTYNYYFCEYKNCDYQVYDEKIKWCRMHEEQECKHNYEKSIDIEYDRNSYEYKKYEIKSCSKCRKRYKRIVDRFTLYLSSVTSGQFEDMKKIFKKGD